MNALRQALEDYLTIRRSLGFELKTEGRMLADFVRFANKAGLDTITTEVALAWASLPANGSPGWQARRLRMVRGFARHLKAVDSRADVPPTGLLPGRNRRPTPYLYSKEDVASLLAAARTLSPPLRSSTIETLIGLLAVTGLRVSEAMALDRDDVDWVNETLTVRSGKFGKSRLVPLHHSTAGALAAYGRLRDQLCPNPSAPSFFVSTRGARLAHSTVYPAFRSLLRQVGLEQLSSARRPRMHDLRHSFAVKTLVNWYRDGEDVGARMPLLSTYLGHVDPGATYWYLSAAPELLNLASVRAENALGASS